MRFKKKKQKERNSSSEEQKGAVFFRQQRGHDVRNNKPELQTTEDQFRKKRASSGMREKGYTKTLSEGDLSSL